MQCRCLKCKITFFIIHNRCQKIHNTCRYLPTYHDIIIIDDFNNLSCIDGTYLPIRDFHMCKCCIFSNVQVLTQSLTRIFMAHYGTKQCNLRFPCNSQQPQTTEAFYFSPSVPFRCIVRRAATVIRVHPRCHGDSCSRENIDTGVGSRRGETLGTRETLGRVRHDTLRLIPQ